MRNNFFHKHYLPFYLIFKIQRKIIKIKNKTHIIGVISLYFLAAIIQIGYVIMPREMPSEILYVKGIPNKIKNAAQNKKRYCDKYWFIIK